MTALCGGGSSRPKTGTSAVVDYSAGLIAAIFAAYDIAWLIPVIPLVGLAPLTLSTFCGTDPPSVSGLTTAEANALLQLQLGSDFDSGIAKIKDLILNAIWHDACECVTAGVTPTPFAPPAPPSGTPILVTPTGTGVQPCFDYSGRDAPAAGANIDYTKPAFSPLVPTMVVLDATVLAASGSFTMTLELDDMTSGGAFIRGYSLSINSTAVSRSKSVQLPITAGADHFRIRISNAGSATPLDTQWSVKIYCGGQVPSAGSQPCCPPDTIAFSYLDSILQMVTLIQRQIVPFAHILGPSHPALTGQGSIGVSGLLGVKLDLTTIPASYGVAVGSPDYHFDLGWLSVLTADGLIDERRISAQLTAWFPQLMSDATVIGYSLEPGVVGTITEIVREP